MKLKNQVSHKPFFSEFLYQRSIFQFFHELIVENFANFTEKHLTHSWLVMVKAFFRLMEDVLYKFLHRIYLKRALFSTKKGSAIVMMSSL